MPGAATKVRATVGKDVIGNIDGAEHIPRTLRERFAPHAIGSIFQDMVKFLFCKRTGQIMDAFLAEFDMLRQKADARMILGSCIPDGVASVNCMQNAALTKNEQTLVLASSRNALAI